MGKEQFKVVVIASFSLWKNGKRTPFNGMIESMLSFFGPKTRNIILIDCPHPESDDLRPKIEYYKHDTLIKTFSPPFLFPPLFILEKFNTKDTQIKFKLRDFLTVSRVLLLQKGNIDLFIGLESIYALAGILFKKLGRVKTVVYYVSDYSPYRYPNKIFNSIYVWLDRICSTHADFIWDVSKAMMPARIKAGLKKEDASPVIHVPNALFHWQIKYFPVERLKPYSLVFAGSISSINGSGLAIEALEIVRKQFPKVTLHIFGGGRKTDEKYLFSLVKKMHLTNAVIHHGLISDLGLLSKMLMKYMIGLAPYRAIAGSVRWYADATKIRLYFASGLPVITTQVPPLGKEAAEKGCALVVEDTKEALAQAIIEMLSDKKKYAMYRKAAIAFAEHNTWENTYKEAIKQMNMSL